MVSTAVLLGGRPVTKSKALWDQGRLGMGRGRRSQEWGLVEVLFRAQMEQAVTNDWVLGVGIELGTRGRGAGKLALQYLPGYCRAGPLSGHWGQDDGNGPPGRSIDKTDPENRRARPNSIGSGCFRKFRGTSGDLGGTRADITGEVPGNKDR
ncbi:unnamed protein product [Merluccius merluccius]